MTDRTLSCSCKAMSWRVAAKSGGAHIVCYCKDCQAFANVLGRQDMLDAHGGTAIFQTLPADFEILDGQGHLACLRLGPKGLIRWFAGCCNTPICNTLPKPGLPFVGLVLPHRSKEFGRVTAHVQTSAAHGRVREHGFGRTGAALMARAAWARLTGRAGSPFFDTSGQPIVAPRLLTREERKAATP